MTLVVLPALDAELEPLYDVWLAAFKDQPAVSILFPEGADRKAQVELVRQSWGDTGYPIKCVDTETGEIVGMATWEIFWRSSDDSGWKNPGCIPWLTAEDWNKAKEVVLPMWDVREKLFGKRRHVYLGSMAVHPRHQRRGIGRLLVQWGIDIAERLDLPIYLEATLEGMRLYEHAGFKKLTQEKVILSESVTGIPGGADVPLMVKMPSAANGLSFEEWANKGSADAC